jgi:transposase
VCVHRSARARRAIEAAGCQILPTPRYSPDCNPIEQAFSKIKTALRRAEARTFDTIVAATGAAFATITPTDARSYFAAAGYPVAGQP